MKKLIFLGDSLTFGYGVRRAECWAALTAGALGCEAVNLGISGDTAAGMLCRLQTQVLPQLKDTGIAPLPPVFLLGGGNDIIYTGTDAGARSHMGAIVQQLLSAGAQPIVLSPLPMAADALAPQWRAMLPPEAASLFRQYRTWLADFCRAFRVPYIDLQAALLTSDGKPMPELYLDGLHPTAEGHRRIAAQLLAALPDDFLKEAALT